MKNEPINPKKILSIYPTIHGVSYSYFENQNSLVSWGNISHKPGNVTEKVQALIDEFQPEMIISEQIKSGKINRGKQTIKSLKNVRNLAEKNNIYLKLYSRLTIKGVFSCFEATNKQQIAVYLSKTFPELKSKLPPKPKVWESQHYRMGVFDSVAFAFAYYYIEGDLNEN